MDFFEWFKIDVLFKATSGLDDEELTEIEQIQLRNESLINGDGYEKEVAYFNLGVNRIKSLEPKCFIPSGKKNKKYYTEIFFEDTTSSNADGKPDDVYQKLREYYESLPAPPSEDPVEPETSMG